MKYHKVNQDGHKNTFKSYFKDGKWEHGKVERRRQLVGRRDGSIHLKALHSMPTQAQVFLSHHVEMEATWNNDNHHLLRTHNVPTLLLGLCNLSLLVCTGIR